MKDYTIAEEFTLPSLGKIYEKEVNPNVKIRSMTTLEEMRRLAPSEYAYKNLCELIDDCIVEDIGISAYDMHPSDYQYLLHKLRIVTYGVDYKYMSTCPYCGEAHEGVVDLSTFPVTQYEDGSLDKYLKFTLPQTGKTIELNIQTPRIIDSVNKKAKDNKKYYHDNLQESIFIHTLLALIKSIDGENINDLKKEQFIKSLPMKDTNYILKSAQKIVESFGMDTTLHVVCHSCGLDYNTPFRITSEFFGPEI